MKGLQRSLARGPASQRGVIRYNVPINTSITVTGVSGAVDAGTAVLGALPQGNLLLMGAVLYASIDASGDANIINAWAGDFGVGYAANADTDLSDAQEDGIIASTALAADAGGKLAPTTRAISTQSEHSKIVNNTDGTLEVNFNLLIDDNSITDTEGVTFAVTGSLHLVLIVLGDD